jgi:hypothetical protein
MVRMSEGDNDIKRGLEDTIFLGEDPTEKVREVIERNFPGLWKPLDVALSAWTELLIEDITLPVALFFVGPPSSWKTTLIEILKVPNESYHVDQFTPAAFVSASVNVPSNKLPEIDLLPKIKGKLFLVPEMAPLWNMSRDHLVENVGIMTRVLDGQGLVRHTGTHGTRGYNEPIMFVWIAGTTPIPKRIWDLMGKLGSRLYFYPMDNDLMDEDELLKLLRDSKAYFAKVRECRDAVAKLMAKMRSLGRVRWNKANDKDDILRRLIPLAEFLARMRGSIETHYNESGGVEHYPPTIEQPSRALTWLYNLARGHAVLHGRLYLTEEDLKILYPIVLASGPYERARALEALAKLGGSATLKDFAEALGCSKEGARIIAYTLKNLGLVKLYEDPKAVGPKGGRPPLTIHLYERYLSIVRTALEEATRTGSVSLAKPEEGTTPSGLAKGSGPVCEERRSLAEHTGQTSLAKPFEIEVEHAGQASLAKLIEDAIRWLDEVTEHGQREADGLAFTEELLKLTGGDRESAIAIARELGRRGICHYDIPKKTVTFIPPKAPIG